jgi:hypothetical protein
MTLKVRGGGQIFTDVQHVDPKSRQVVEDVVEIAKAVRALRQELLDAPFKKDDSFRIRSQAELKIRLVDEHGATFQPTLAFTPALSSIVLTTGVHDKQEPLDVFDKIGKLLSADFGPDDEATRSEDGRRRVWRFPKTRVILSLKTSSVTVPVMSVRQGGAGRNVYQETVQQSTHHVITLEYVADDLGDAADRLEAHESLLAGDCLRSMSGQHVLKVLPDGNLAIYSNGEQSPRWTSGTFGKNTARLVIRDDGDVVLLDAAGAVVWRTNTAGKGGNQLVMQDDGNLVLYKATQAVWATNTERR